MGRERGQSFGKSNGGEESEAKLSLRVMYNPIKERELASVRRWPLSDFLYVALPCLAG